ncbi:HemK2/MTQ2 family protein methyltransferase [Mycobacterium sp. BMJ-28]
MTIIADGPATTDVYLPQQDSDLLVDTMLWHTPPRGLRVADLCTGSGVVALAAAAAGALSVSAFDVSPDAVAFARARAAAGAANIDVYQLSWEQAVTTDTYDLVLCNPPYVPQPPDYDPVACTLPIPALAVDGGSDGRLVLDPLCAAAPALLRAGGTLLVVQSELADVGKTVDTLRRNGLRSQVVAEKCIPFGPVLHSRARWLEATGRLPVNKRVETLAVIAATKP